ncbi:hypothetical protein SNK04_014059 [Fusarium graminearum]
MRLRANRLVPTAGRLGARGRAGEFRGDAHTGAALDHPWMETGAEQAQGWGATARPVDCEDWAEPARGAEDLTAGGGGVPRTGHTRDRRNSVYRWESSGFKPGLPPESGNNRLP